MRKERKKERERKGGGRGRIFAHLDPVEMLQSQTHDKGRESKGEFTRCVYRARGVHREKPRARARATSGPLVLELVATARKWYLFIGTARASTKLIGSWSPKC